MFVDSLCFASRNEATTLIRSMRFYERSSGKIGRRICSNGSERRSLVQGPSVLTVWLCFAIGS